MTLRRPGRTALGAPHRSYRLLGAALGSGLFVVAGAPAGCSSSSSSPADEDVGATGVYGDKQTACTRYIAALVPKARALNCTLTPPPSCPAWLDQFEASLGLGGKCAEYDLGTIDRCVAKIALYAQCDDITKKPCRIAFRPATTCADAGAPSDASPDAPPDGAPDARLDAPQDTSPPDAPPPDAVDPGDTGPGDVGVDAPADAGGDASADAAPEAPPVDAPRDALDAASG